MTVVMDRAIEAQTISNASCFRRASKEFEMACMLPKEKLPKTGSYDILVASPGRLYGFLKDQCQDRQAYFRRTTFVVVDEADHLLLKNEKDGEQHTIDILKSLRPDIQMLYFTATWDDTLPQVIVEDIGRTHSNHAVKRAPLTARSFPSLARCRASSNHIQSSCELFHGCCLEDHTFRRVQNPGFG